MRKATVGGICAAYAEKGARITVKPLPDHPDVILFEGDELAFEFLGKLFLAHAKAIQGCGFSLGPKYAGRAFFSKKATLGLYLHRLPCDDDGWKAASGKKQSGHRPSTPCPRPDSGQIISRPVGTRLRPSRAPSS